MAIANLGRILNEFILCAKLSKEVSHRQQVRIRFSRLSALTYIFLIPSNLPPALSPPESNVLESFQPFISQSRDVSVFAVLVFHALLEYLKRSNRVCQIRLDR
eukprot:scaffold2482_cov145-Skeletonema_dohrnii-CCMP3373.AAC.9